MQKLRELAQKKSLECKVKSQAYKNWLKTLQPANLIFVVGAALLSLIAGSSLLIDQEILKPHEAGIMALVSAGFTIIHSKLNCDQHQAECRKLKSQYEALSLSYADLDTVTDESEFKRKMSELNSEFAQIVKNTTAEPSEKAIKRAKDSISV